MPKRKKYYDPELPTGEHHGLADNYELFEKNRLISIEWTEREYPKCSIDGLTPTLILPSLQSESFGVKSSPDDAHHNLWVIHPALHIVYKDDTFVPNISEHGIEKHICAYVPEGALKAFMQDKEYQDWKRREELMVYINKHRDNPDKRQQVSESVKEWTRLNSNLWRKTQARAIDGFCYHAPSHTYELQPSVFDPSSNHNKERVLKVFPNAPEFNKYSDFHQNILQTVLEIEGMNRENKIQKYFIAIPNPDSQLLGAIKNRLQRKWTLHFQYRVLHKAPTVKESNRSLPHHRYESPRWMVQYWESK